MTELGLKSRETHINVMQLHKVAQETTHMYYPCHILAFTAHR